jgi:hypothetical protein
MMTRLRHSGNAGQQPAGKNPFPLIRALQERRYRQTVRDIARTEELLDGISGKRAVYAELVRSSHASVVDEDGSNWDRAMAETKTYHSCRKELKGESAGAAFQLFSKTMFQVAILGGASLCMLHAAIPGMNALIAGAIGSLFTLGAALKTWALVSTGSQEFLDAVHANIQEQAHSLGLERRRLIKKLHGWKPPNDL